MKCTIVITRFDRVSDSDTCEPLVIWSLILILLDYLLSFLLESIKQVLPNYYIFQDEMNKENQKGSTPKMIVFFISLPDPKGMWDIVII